MRTLTWLARHDDSRTWYCFVPDRDVPYVLVSEVHLSISTIRSCSCFHSAIIFCNSVPFVVLQERIPPFIVRHIVFPSLNVLVDIFYVILIEVLEHVVVDWCFLLCRCPILGFPLVEGQTSALEHEHRGGFVGSFF